MIYHVTSEAEWNRYAGMEFFLPDAFEKDGFIHLSTEKQLAGVLQRYYKGREDLMLLTVDESKLEAVLKHEPSTGNELYPHLYGELNKSAIIKIEPLSK